MNLEQINEKLLGKKIKDKVSGLSGVVVSVTIFLNGCIRVSIQPPIDKDGKMPSESWFDWQQVELLKTKKIKTNVSRTGGPQTTATPNMR